MIKVVFVTVQFEHVNSGPGTFANYLFREYSQRDDIDFHVVTEDVNDYRDYGQVVTKVDVPYHNVFRNRLWRGIYYCRVLKKMEDELEKVPDWR